VYANETATASGVEETVVEDTSNDVQSFSEYPLTDYSSNFFLKMLASNALQLYLKI